MAPKSDNERGFFENEDIYRVHEKILGALGSSWDSPFPLPEGWEGREELRESKAALAGILGDSFAGDLILVKDPRLCRLLPLWKDLFAALGLGPLAIISLRHPMEVADSLARRNGFTPEKSAILWMLHYLGAEGATRDVPRAFVSYDSLMADPRGTLRGLVRALGLPPAMESEAALSAATAFLEEGLRHHRAGAEEPDRGMLRAACDCYRALLRLALPTPEAEEARSALEDARRDFFRMYDFFYNADLLADSRRWAAEAARIAEEARKLKEDQDLLVNAKGKIDSLERRFRAKDAELHAILGSKSWRLTAPLRALALDAKTSSRRAGKLAGSAARALYRRLPLAPARKEGLKRVLLALGGPLLKRPGAGVRPGQVLTLDGMSLASAARPLPPKAIRRAVERCRVAFDRPANPAVSIVIPVFNQLGHTFNCLRSIARHTKAPSYEVILIDDCSTDESAELLPKIPGLRYFRNERNSGFIASCNRGAELAAGEQLLFLNNDTLVTPGWLEALAETFRVCPDAGLVGAKLVFPDGRMQECGAIVRDDGSAYQHGRLGDPLRPEYGFLREVDYCSGACVLIPRRLFLELGMFDPRYAPAYYEDVDLAFKVRAAGRKVYCQGQAMVIHAEGTSSGTDTSRGVKKYQVVNAATFRERWSAALAGQPGVAVPEAEAIDRNVALRVLVVDAMVCKPDQDAGSLRMHLLLRMLRELGCRVSFFPANRHYPEPYARDMQLNGTELIQGEGDPLAEFLRRRGKAVDVAILSRVEVARERIDLVRSLCPRAKVLFDTVDLHYLRESREAELKGDEALRAMALRTKEEELSVAARADATIVVSEEEGAILRSELPGLATEVIPTINLVGGSKRPFRDRHGLVFVGGFNHPPNADAVHYFIAEIFPLLRASIPGITLRIIGSNPPPEIENLDCADIIVTGFVPELEPYFDACRLSVAPLRFGAGVKGKINSSMSCGLPVVATPIAAEGMFLRDGHDVLIGGDARGFAEAVERLYEDEELWNRLSSNGLENVRRHFSFEAIKESVRAMLADLG